MNNEQDMSVELNGTSVPVWFLDKGVSEGSYACMAQTEGLSTYNGKLLVLYESGATKYRGDAVNPTDHVWAVTFPSNEE